MRRMRGLKDDSKCNDQDAEDYSIIGKPWIHGGQDRKLQAERQKGGKADYQWAILKKQKELFSAVGVRGRRGQRGKTLCDQKSSLTAPFHHPITTSRLTPKKRGHQASTWHPKNPKKPIENYNIICSYNSLFFVKVSRAKDNHETKVSLNLHPGLTFFIIW